MVQNALKPKGNTVKTQPVAISYIRFSTAEQAKGNSFKRQIEESTAWCQRNNWVLDTSHRLNDLGLSGFKGRNAKTGKLKAFLDGLESGKIVGDGLIIESLDRLSRDEVGDALRLFLNILSHGIKIITTKPENIFDQKSINDPANLIMAILEICRGFSESSMKSGRVANAWKDKKTAARNGHKVTRKCPGWLELVGERSKDLTATNQEFKFVPEKVASVKRIIQLATSGIGIESIARTLNQEGLPTLSPHAKRWHGSAVYKTLTNRALLGEYQPRFSNKYLSQKHRKPDGEPIQGYYLPLITEAEFLQLQSHMQTRRVLNPPKSGRGSTKISNLFAKVMKCANTDKLIYRIDKGKKSVPALISEQVGAGLAGAEEKFSFPYDDYEFHFLTWLKEVNISDLGNEKQISEAQGRLLVVKEKMSKKQTKLKDLKARLKSEDEDIDTVVDVIKEVDAELKDLRREVAILEIEAGKSKITGEAGTLVKALDEATGQDKIELRGKLKFLIAELIEVIYVRIEKDMKGRRWIFSQVHFRNGLVRKLVFNATMTYSGGGLTNPMPHRESRSVSTEQIALGLDLRNPNDFVGWFANIIIGEEVF